MIFETVSQELPCAHNLNPFSLRFALPISPAGYSILFNNKWIQVHRPDVECTNGIIHVIDYPLLEDSDVIVNGAQMIDVLKHLVLMAVLARFLL